jgi:hypothetical protein
MNNDSNQTIEDRLTILEQRMSALEATAKHNSVVSPGHSQPKQISAKEFLLSKNLSSTVEKTLALAYYLEHIESKSSFNIEDIASAFQSAREKVPSNPNDMINKNIAKAFLMEARELKDSKKAWVLTATGEKFVENGFKS